MNRSANSTARSDATLPGDGAINLQDRCRLPELMDDPDLDADQHHDALAGLRRLNRWSRSGAILWSELRRLAEEVSPRPLRILDIATGGGDMVVDVAKRAQSAGVAVQVDGCDISSQAIQYAQQFAEQHNPGQHRFFVANALTGDLPEEYDVLMSSLFLHHLDSDDAVTLMRQMSRACRRAILINDLRRTRFGYVLAVAACRLLTRSPIVHVDGPLSVRAAWSDSEVRQLAEEAGLNQPQLSHHWPQRFLLSWRKP